MKKFLIYTLSLSAIVGCLALGAVTVFAQNNDTYKPIVQRIAEKFNLNPEEVNQVFEQERKEKHQNMQLHCEERLNQAVADGKMTEEQKNEILAKHAEMEQKRAEFENLTSEQRQEKMQEMRQEMEENGIDFGMFGKPGKRGRFMAE